MPRFEKRVFGRFGCGFAVVGACAVFGVAGASNGGIDPNSGIDFVTITHPNNAPWGGGPGAMNNLVGRGSVAYEYRIGKFEVTTAQWVEFFNAAYDRPSADRLPYLSVPTFWGAASAAPTTPGGLRWRVPAGNEMRAVGNISWRMAAMYCNWLHNGKGTDRSAFLAGAYDVSTFGGFGVGFTDQLTRSPGARYFIPTLDEWMKAAHYDPDRFGPEQEGWWHYSITSDAAPIPGRPGQVTPNGLAQANYGNYDPVGDVSQIPLGAYSNVMSPWGLFDTAGATAEWLEDPLFNAANEAQFRRVDGSFWFAGSSPTDRVWGGSSDSPVSQGYDLGFRIAALIPSSSTLALLLPGGLAAARRRR